MPTVEDAIRHLQNFLRYVAAGFVPIAISFSIETFENKSRLNILFTTPYFWPTVALGFLLGVTLYSTHITTFGRLFSFCNSATCRTIAHRQLKKTFYNWTVTRLFGEWQIRHILSDRNNIDDKISNLVKMTGSEILAVADLARIRRRFSTSHEAKAYQAFLDQWTALLHFMFSAGYCLAIQPTILWLLRINQWTELSIVYTVCGIMVIFFAFRSSVREGLWELWAGIEYSDNGGERPVTI